jgi:Fe-S oxidoreductase
VARASLLFEEYLDGLAKPLSLTAGPATVLLHGHCHQRSMGLVSPARALLSRIPGTTVVDLDAGCCGMAGSFGYAREHYDISRAIGEQKLFPAVRRKPAGAVVVAAGTSCRHQIRDFTGETAVHPAVLLRSLLST